jgi:sirohydrochlorin ferrochelatase
MMHSKMKAVLYICHGSRIGEANEQAISFIQQVMKKVDIPIQEISFLELSEPTIAQGFERCVEKGATTIIAIPILLLTAAHAKIDMPNELTKLTLRFPDIKVKFGQPIGVHEKMIDLLLERVRDTQIPIKEESKVLLVGRGSSDPDVKRDITRIAEMLEQRSPVKRVEVCFLTAAKPSFQEGLEEAKRSGAKQVFVIPYLFFTGILMGRIENSIKNVNINQKTEWILCRYLGYHPIVEEIIYEQIIELSR